MEIANIDNSFNLSRSVLWQYDHAANLLGMFSGVADILKEDVTDFWDWFVKEVGNIDEADYFGLNVWGITLGIPRPFIPHGQITDEKGVDEDGNEVYALSDEVYRRLLKARMYMLDANASAAEFAEGLKIAFEGRVGIVDGSDCDPQQPMAVFYTNNLVFETEGGVTTATPGDPLIAEPQSEYLVVEWEEYDLLTNPDIFEQVFPYPSGVKTPGGAVSWKYAIGLNEDEGNGQNLRNFAPKHADVIDDTVNGGQFAISENGPWQTEQTQ